LTIISSYDIIVIEREVDKMKIYKIDEENHGLIGIVTSPKEISQFLICEKWLDERTESLEGELWEVLKFANREACTSKALEEVLCGLSLGCLTELLENFGFYISEDETWCYAEWLHNKIAKGEA